MNLASVPANGRAQGRAPIELRAAHKQAKQYGIETICCRACADYTPVPANARRITFEYVKLMQGQRNEQR